MKNDDIDMYPYGGTNKSEDAKIERCVSSLMEDPKFKPRKGKDKKSSAIAVCKASIMGGKMEMETFDYTPEDSEQYTKGTAIKDVHVFKAGKYRGKTWTKDMVDKMVESFKKLKEAAGFEPPVRIGHRTDNPTENAKSIIGYIEHLRHDGNGNAYADLDITDDEGYKKIKEGTLRKRSIEFGPYETNDGNTFDNVLWGLGWVDIPQVEKLAEVNVYSQPMKQEKKDEEQIDEMEKGKEGDSCKMANGKEGKMKMKDGKMICMPKKEMMDKEDEDLDNNSEDSQDDSADDSSEAEENASDKAGEDAAEDGDDAESKEVQMDKDDKMVQLSKEQYDKFVVLEKQVTELRQNERVTKIESLAKEAKILSDKVDEEKEFALSLSDEQFEKYLAIKSVQPEFVKLDQELGEQKQQEPTNKANTEADESKEAIALAEQVTEKYRKQAEQMVTK